MNWIISLFTGPVVDFLTKAAGYLAAFWVATDLQKAKDKAAAATAASSMQKAMAEAVAAAPSGKAAIVETLDDLKKEI